MKNWTLQIRCILLAAMSLVCGILASGCQKPTAAEAFADFLGCLHTGDFEAAYEMLSASARYDEDRAAADLAAGKEQSATRISKEQFVNRHQAIFEELGVTGLSYTVTSAKEESEIISIYDYTLTYTSEKIGQEEWQFRMTVLREDGVWKVDWAPDLIFPDMDWGDTIRVGTIRASRGEIIAGGEVLAETVKAVSITCVPSKIEDEAQFVRQVSVLLDMTSEEVYDRLGRVYHDFVLIKQLYPDQLTESLEEQLLLIPGIGIDTSNYGELRNYPQGESLAHILGYVRTADEEDLTRLTGGVLDENGKLVDPDTGETLTNTGYAVDSVVGKAGLERQYEKELRGVDGSYVYICGSDGSNKGTLYREPVQNGLDVQLTINPDLQTRVETLLSLTLYGENTAGAVIVMNPLTGAVDAMASYPSYDLNKYTRGWTAAEWEEINSKKNTPLYNRLIQGRYPPGSILKPFTAAAALESGSMTPSTEFPQGRGETIEDDRRWRPSDSGEFGPWGYAYITRVSLNNRHYPLNMHSGIIDSDNIYFAYAALRTGEESFSQFMTRVGLTEAVDFDLSVTKAQLKNEDSEWTPMLLADSAYGQGEVLVTPLQAASMFCAFANGGTIMRPYVVKGLYRTEGTDYTPVSTYTPQAWKENVVQQSSINTIEPMLVDVVREGTGRNLNYKDNKAEGKRNIPRSPKLTNIAAKTGTAQIGNDRRREISWFVGYRTGVSSEEARLVLVMLEIPASDTNYSNMKYDIAYDLLKPEGNQE